MKYRNTVKNLALKVLEGIKKKESKIVLKYKKEIIPFLGTLRESGFLYKFIISGPIITVFLKTRLSLSRGHSHRYENLKVYKLEARIFKNASSVTFISTNKGVLIDGLQKKFDFKNRVGGKQLLVLN